MDSPTEKTTRVPILVVCLTLAVILFIPLRIIAYNYLPPDDALRHAAKAVSGEDWGQILVLRPDITIDSHQGWHAILGAVHRRTGAGPDELVVFEVVTLFILFSLVPLVSLRRPEAWLVSLSILCLAEPVFITRLLLGRPFIFTMAVLIAILFNWKRFASIPAESAGMVIATILLVALSTWIHGLWYMWALPILCFLAARQWKAAGLLSLSTGAGVLLGAIMTGRPWAFLAENASHLVHSFGDYRLTRMLAVEFQPMEAGAALPLAVLLLILWRKSQGETRTGYLSDPVFLVAALGWVLGLAVQRFWLDWGLPATLVWISLRIEQALAGGMNLGSGRRLLAAGAAAATIFLLMTADVQSRWTSSAAMEFLSRDNPEQASWLPEPGGIVYSNAMEVFYRTFFRNPDAPWRYVLGFEPGMMRGEDLAVYRDIQWNFGDYRAYRPWVAKMTPRDRLIIKSAGEKPDIPPLEWFYAATKLWVGRLPGR